MDDSLSFESFLTGAGRAAYKAMEDHGRSEYDEFALHGGVAVERLAKAVLVKKNPTYLVEMRNGNSDLLLYFGGDLELDPDKVRTVGAKEALQRLRRIKVLPPDPQLDRLIDLRNGTAHTTVGDEARSLLPTFAETIAILLKAVDMSAEQFWGRWISAVNVAVDKQRDAIQRDVKVRIKQARHLFDDRFKGLPEGAKERALKEPVEGPHAIAVSGEDDNLIVLISTLACPACGEEAHIRMTPIRSTTTGAEVTVDLLDCPLCGLKLTGPEEIKASGADIEKAVVPSNIIVSWGMTLPTPLDLNRINTA
ncbi:hypothetical protein [Streptomyces sp. NPDC050704]|uniref:hypothetical protein n=1 Tax=Streptomyces sp. NPDC050704 TaxID=3157219 RepID=UPI003440851A